MTHTPRKILATVTVGLAVAGCGQSHHNAQSAAVGSGGAPAAGTPTDFDQLALVSGSPQHQISETIRAFYKATWQNDDKAACSLFSPTGLTGFMAAAKVAFPATVNSTTTCPQVMAYFNADLADSVDTLQQSGVDVSGNILDVVGVKDIKISGNTATAEGPEGVEEIVAPKIFTLARINGRWLISGSRKIGQTLPQLLAQAKKKGELIPGVNAPAKTTPGVTPAATASTAKKK